jgi:5-methylcytosine-specific restriction endonuclease McrA
MALAALWQSGMRANSPTNRATEAQVSQSQASVHSKEAHPVIIRKPSGPPRIELAGTDPQGRTGSVACSTCHSVRQANLENKTAATLDEFHQGMTFNHGNITCYACHNPSESDALRLADGSSVAYENVMALCSQCHSKQAESFAHGAHGGMNGYWDLGRGPQMKNNCIDCHDPHVPKYPKMIVGFKPKDRFNEPSKAELQQEGTAVHEKH